ncbi:protein of unknown function [Ectopseudomonas oleovorans]|nr:protein of unknown function [Pseudomonas oleovorans]
MPNTVFLVARAGQRIGSTEQQAKGGDYESGSEFHGVPLRC